MSQSGMHTSIFVESTILKMLLYFRSYMLSEKVPGIPPQFGAHHGGDIPFVMQKLGVVAPGVSPSLIELEHTIGDYWYVLSLSVIRLLDLSMTIW